MNWQCGEADDLQENGISLSIYGTGYVKEASAYSSVCDVGLKYVCSVE